MGRPRILFLDAYDSFSNNIVSLLTTVLGADVDVLPIDPLHLNPAEPGFHDALRRQVERYDAIVCGPGPGAPHRDKDVGLMKHVWDLQGQHLRPVLGICLGFQSLVVSCAAPVKRLRRTGLHGMIREIDHQATSAPSNIFAGVPPFKATLYHSLHADIDQESISAAEWPDARWTSPPAFPDIVPLAWTYEDRGDMVERILMGVRHRSKPFWGLQYHPESVCTESTGHQVIRNWFQEAMAWNRACGRKTEPVPPKLVCDEALHASVPSPELPTGRPLSTCASAQTLPGRGRLECVGANAADYFQRSLRIPLHVEVPDVVEILQSDRKEHIVLDSASAKTGMTGMDVRGRYSIIGLDIDDACKLEYTTGSHEVLARVPSPDPARCTSQSSTTTERIELSPGDTIWQFLARFWSSRKISNETPGPFVGGFMGYTTYELGLEGIHVRRHDDRQRFHNRPDLSFAWVTKSIVIDHLEGTLRLQILSSAESDARQWLDSTADKLVRSTVWTSGIPDRFGRAHRVRVDEPTPPHTPVSGHFGANISVPDGQEYEAKVRLCQDFIAAGDSYELCLTDQTLITRPRSPFEGTLQPHTHAESNPATTTSSISSWQLYRSLRVRQPAPFGSYIRLGPATLVSSSPERFLSFSPDSGKESIHCSMRPMKGTVRKSSAVSTLAAAERILHVPKEEAENLMIVDLVRHDLHGVCGPGNVSVPDLLKVEEYASVFQMISVVEGRLAQTEILQKTGLDVLAASLPPGSMTGAPKKRSCEILQEVEGPRGRVRSLYSGVVGYMDATGRGDWSVTIRSLFRWDDETTTTTTTADPSGVETWHIGAGGAVTALSTAEGEADEMFTKLKGPLSVFEEA
ncbi:aminodeoxychorismate synthase [Xylariaceae sp. FL0594]|nr:aminodeoxychorismate synthase [Xylariaceae sp. FL0594]